MRHAELRDARVLTVRVHGLDGRRNQQHRAPVWDVGQYVVISSFEGSLLPETAYLLILVEVLTAFEDAHLGGSGTWISQCINWIVILALFPVSLFRDSRRLQVRAYPFFFFVYLDLCPTEIKRACEVAVVVYSILVGMMFVAFLMYVVHVVLGQRTLFADVRLEFFLFLFLFVCLFVV